MSRQGPCVHSVHVYDNVSALVARLCGIVSSGLKIGDSVLVIAAGETRARLTKELERCGVNVRGNARDGRFVMCDAEETLSSFMQDGKPNVELFDATVGRVLSAAKNAARSKDRDLIVFGEMVAVLWRDGNQDGALALEALWNEALRDNAFHLHCAYPRSVFHDERDIDAIKSLHSHILEDLKPSPRAA